MELMAPARWAAHADCLSKLVELHLAVGRLLPKNQAVVRPKNQVEAALSLAARLDEAGAVPMERLVAAVPMADNLAADGASEAAPTDRQGAPMGHEDAAANRWEDRAVLRQRLEVATARCQRLERQHLGGAKDHYSLVANLSDRVDRLLFLLFGHLCDCCQAPCAVWSWSAFFYAPSLCSGVFQ